MEKTTLCNVSYTEQICNKCKKGSMIFTGGVESKAKKDLFHHLCNNAECLAEAQYTKTYPDAEFVPIGKPAKPEPVKEKGE